jgi:hypothetical protein
MKFFIALILTALLAFAVGLQLPWWFIAVAALVVAFAIPQSNTKAALAGFLGVFLLWVVLAYVSEQKGSGLMAKQMAYIIPLKGNTLLLILATGLIGGLVGCFGALTGSLGRKLLRKETV